MDEGRLLYVRNITKRRQKVCAAVNDKMKERLRVVAESMEKDKKSTSFRSWQNSVGLKWAYTKGRYLQKRLEEDSVCDNEEDSPRTYGRYDGTRLASYRRQIDGDIAFNHPKERRKRQIQAVRNNLEKYGMFSDYSQMNEKLESILERPPIYKINLDNVVRQQRKRPVLRRRPAVHQRAQLRPLPVAVSRDTYKKLSAERTFPLEVEPLASIHHSRSSTLMSF